MKQREDEEGVVGVGGWMHITYALICTEWGVSSNTTALIRYSEWGKALFSDALHNYVDNEAWGGNSQVT